MYVVVLGVDGASIGEYYVGGARLSTLPEPDRLRVSGLVSPLPRAGAREIWEVWRPGRPRVSNEWAGLPIAARDAWLEVVGKYWFATMVDGFPSPHRLAVILDGAHIQNPASFFCAFGEAVNGPGGYFGWSLTAFADCLSGGFGVTGPFTLKWTDFDVAGHHLTSPIVDGRPYLDVILDILRDYQIEVVSDDGQP